jgi:hypothetical protein
VKRGPFLLQEMLEEAGVPHTGSGAAASRTCMHKYATAKAISHVSDLLSAFVAIGVLFISVCPSQHVANHRSWVDSEASEW